MQLAPKPQPLTEQELRQADKIMTMAKVRMEVSDPFSSTLLRELEWVRTESIKTMATDGVQHLWNPRFVLDVYSQSHEVQVRDRIGNLTGRKLTIDGLSMVINILTHEACHCWLGHSIRMGKRHPKRWNIACDWVVNHELDKLDVPVKESGLRNPDAANLTAEKAYLLTEDEKGTPPPPPPQPPEGDDGDGGDESEADDDADGDDDAPDQPDDTGEGEGDQPGGEGDAEGDDEADEYGEVLPHPEADPDDPAKTEELEREYREMVSRAMRTAEKMGNMPGHIKEKLSKLISPRKDWRQVLQEFLTRITDDDYSWDRPSMVWLGGDDELYVPSMYSIAADPVFCVIDTSASMSRDILAKCMGHVAKIAADMDAQVIVVHADTQVHKESLRVYEPGETISMDGFFGRGGTHFTPAFTYYEQEIADKYQPGCMIYLTDTGGTVDPNAEPDIPVLWAAYGSDGNFPFGDVVRIDQD